MATTATRKPHTVELLGEPYHHADRTVYVVRVNGRTCWVRDTCDRGGRYWVRSVDSEETHTVFTKGGKPCGCECKDRKYRGGECRHMAAVAKAIEQW